MTVPAHVQEFYDRYAPAAMRNEEQYFVPWQVTLAQAAVESAWGKYAPGFNFFGIKASKAWKGKTQLLKTKEVINNQEITINDRFRAYDSPAESFRDHAIFLQTNKNYRLAFQTRDPKEFAKRVHAGGYATAPNYTTTLWGVIDLLEKARATRPAHAPPLQQPTPQRRGLWYFILRLFGLAK